jgi:hypothetical protein
MKELDVLLEENKGGREEEMTVSWKKVKIHEEGKIKNSSKTFNPGRIVRRYVLVSLAAPIGRGIMREPEHIASDVYS